MNVGFIKADVVKFASKALLKARKNSPHILVGAGILGFVGTTVLASRETLKAQPLIKDAKGYKHMTDELYQDGKLERTDYAKELLHLYSHTSVQLLRVYSPAITVGALSIGAVLQSHHIMQQRNLALVAAYNTLDQVYSRYRGEVKAELGEDKEREIFERVHQEGSVKAYSDDGEVLEKWDGYDDYSGYAKWFDESSPYFKKEQDNEYNKMFLRSTQNSLNDKLHSVGHMFLNEVYDALGLPRTRAGAVVGWIDGSDGDSYIDFGVFNGDTDEARGFINGWSKTVLIDFNVDGVIYDKI